MKRDNVNIKRFVKSIRYAMETLADEAKCYRYEHDPEYLELKEDLKFCLRELEEGEEFAGKLLFKKCPEDCSQHGRGDGFQSEIRGRTAILPVYRPDE